MASSTGAEVVGESDNDVELSNLMHRMTIGGSSGMAYDANGLPVSEVSFGLRRTDSHRHRQEDRSIRFNRTINIPNAQPAVVEDEEDDDDTSDTRATTGDVSHTADVDDSITNDKTPTGNSTSASAGTQLVPWSCEVCTYENTVYTTRCEMCDTTRT